MQLCTILREGPFYRQSSTIIRKSYAFRLAGFLRFQSGHEPPSRCVDEAVAIPKTFPEESQQIPTALMPRVEKRE